MKKKYGVTYGCIGFFDVWRFLSSSLDSLVETLDKNDWDFEKKTSRETEVSKYNLAYPYECFNSIVDC